MHARCRDPKNKGYRYYGGKGIQVCAEWKEFVEFYEWAMPNGFADGLSIERKNSSLGYSPQNCEWITFGENSRRANAQRKALKLAA